MTDTHTKILDLVEEGTLDAEYALRCALNWLGESAINDMVNNMPDFEGYGLQHGEDEEEEEEEMVDGIQYRMVMDDDTPEGFSARIHRINTDGDDVFPPEFEVDAELYNDLPDVDWSNPEEATDHFLTQNGLPYADHYLDEHDEVVWTEV